MHPKQSTLKLVLACAAVAAALSGIGVTLAAFSGTTDTPTSNFTAATSFGPTCTVAGTAWVEGMEPGTGVTPYMFTSQVSASLESTVKRTGTYSVRVAKGAGSWAYARKQGFPISSTTTVLGFGFRVAALPTADTTFAWLDRLNADLLLKYKSSTQKLTLQWGTDPAAEANVALAANTWYWIEIKADTSASLVTASWRINGSDQTAISKADAAAAIGTIYFGSTIASEGPAYTAYYDDIVYSKSLADYPMGEMSVRVLRPNANGAHLNPNHFQDDDGTAIDATSWSRLDDTTLVGGTDSVVQHTASTSSYLEFEWEDPPEQCVAGINAWATAGSIGSSGNSIKMSVFDGSVESVIYSGATGCGNCVRERGAMVTPAATPWTSQAVNDLVLRLGYQRDATPQTRWGHAMLEYATPTP